MGIMMHKTMGACYTRHNMVPFATYCMALRNGEKDKLRGIHRLSQFKEQRKKDHTKFCP